MKNLKNLFVPLLFLITPLSMISGQVKVAHIEVQKLISEMPEVIAAQKELKKLSNIYSPYIIKKLPIRISKKGNAGKKTCIMLTKIKKTVIGKINAIKVTNFKFTFPM